MGPADVASNVYRNGFNAYLGGNPLSLGFLTDRGDLSPFSSVAAAMTGRIESRDVCELACGVAVVQK